MTSWDNQFQELKNQFIYRSRERLSAIESLLEQLLYRPNDVSLLRQIMQHFHWLAGSGGTYGFDEVTQWGTYGEELCDYLLKLQQPVSPADHEKLLSAFQTVQLLFAAAQTVQAAPKQASEFSIPTVKSTAELLIAPGTNMADLSNELTGSTFSSRKTTEHQTGQYYQAAQPAQTQSAPASREEPVEEETYTAYTGGYVSGPHAVQDLTGASNNRSSTPSTGADPASSRQSAGSSSSYLAPDSGGANAASNPIIKTTPPNSTAETPKSLNPGGPPLSSGPPLTSGVIQGPPAHNFAAGFPTGEIARPKLMHVPIGKTLAFLLDNNLTSLTPVKALLEERGMHVEGFNSTQVVRSLFAERLPDFLFVGVPMGDSNSYELIEHLRSLEGGHRPTVFMLGQQAGFLDKVMAIRAGADAFFEYPAEHLEMVQKLQSLTDRDAVVQHKILSVEDDQNQADFIKLTLETAGYQVVHIADPKKFEDTFLSFEPDLVLLDVMLGDMTGFEIAKYIRQNDRFAALPIVFLTTQNKLHQHIRSAIAGGDEHLIKPVAPQLLIATVASRLEKSRALKRLIDRDGLTRCLNYGTFMERAQRLTAPENIRNSPSLMMIDIDNMKLVNEQFGFAAGDRVITNISNVLLKGFRNTDMIARFGNDQFAIVLEHLSDVQLQALASQVLSAISNTPQLVKNRAISVTCSCGVSAFEQGMTLQQWVSAAESALVKAKEGGKNRAIVRPSGKGLAYS